MVIKNKLLLWMMESIIRCRLCSLWRCCMGVRRGAYPRYPSVWVVVVKLWWCIRVGFWAMGWSWWFVRWWGWIYRRSGTTWAKTLYTKTWQINNPLSNNSWEGKPWPSVQVTPNTPTSVYYKTPSTSTCTAGISLTSPPSKISNHVFCTPSTSTLSWGKSTTSVGSVKKNNSNKWNLTLLM